MGENEEISGKIGLGNFSVNFLQRQKREIDGQKKK